MSRPADVIDLTRDDDEREHSDSGNVFYRTPGTNDHSFTDDEPSDDELDPALATWDSDADDAIDLTLDTSDDEAENESRKRKVASSSEPTGERVAKKIKRAAKSLMDLNADVLRHAITFLSLEEKATVFALASRGMKLAVETAPRHTTRVNTTTHDDLATFRGTLKQLEQAFSTEIGLRHIKVVELVDAIPDLAELVRLFKKDGHRVRTLHLNVYFSAGLIASVIEILQANQTITKLAFDKTDVSAQELAALCSYMEHDTVLTHLDMSGAHVRGQGASRTMTDSLAKLARNTTLKSLSLYRHRGVDITAIADLIETNKTIQILRVVLIDLRDTAKFVRLMDTLAVNTTITDLEFELFILSHDEDGGVEEAIGSMLERNTTLRRLAMPNTFVPARRMAPFMRGLKSNATLEHLAVNHALRNTDEADVLHPYALYLAENRSLKSLDLSISSCNFYVFHDHLLPSLTLNKTLASLVLSLKNPISGKYTYNLSHVEPERIAAMLEFNTTLMRLDLTGLIHTGNALDAERNLAWSQFDHVFEQRGVLY